MKDIEPFDIKVLEQHGNVTVVVPAGEIDIYTAPLLRDTLSESIDAGARHLLVDLAEVSFIDSSGLGVLVVALRRLHACGGSIDLACHGENVIRAFRLTGLLSVFPLHDSREEALAMLAQTRD